MSKLDQTREIVKSNPDMARATLVKKIIEETGLVRSVALTYLHTVQKELATGWQPMGTVPKNCTPVLIKLATPSHGATVVAGYWNGNGVGVINGSFTFDIEKNGLLGWMYPPE